jgi:hypothetical protein
MLLDERRCEFLDSISSGTVQWELAVLQERCTLVSLQKVAPVIVERFLEMAEQPVAGTVPKRRVTDLDVSGG